MPSIKEIISEFAREGILIGPDVAKYLISLPQEELRKIILYAKKNSISVITLETLKVEKLKIQLNVEKKEDKKIIKKAQVRHISRSARLIKLTEFIQNNKAPTVAKEKPLAIKRETKVETKVSTSSTSLLSIIQTKKESVIEKQKGKLELVTKSVSQVEEVLTVKKPSVEKKQEVEVNYTVAYKSPVETEANVEVLKEITVKGKKWKAADFAEYYKYKLNYFKRLLKKRVNPISIKNVEKLNPDQEVGLIGRVFELIKRESFAILVLEDTTGMVTVKIYKDTPAWEALQYLAADDIIGVKGVVGNKGDVIAKEIIFPDIEAIPVKKAPDDVYALFITDIHVGSKYFLEKQFLKFLNWLNLKSDRSRDIARKVKYLIITGDLVDGVGIYPEQEKELVIPDIENQYEYFAKLFQENLERDDIKIILIPGNHDAVRLEEPQPPLPKDLAKDLYGMGVYILPNPSWVRIHRKENFEGFNLLLYHGYVFDWLISNIDAIREGYRKPEIVMKYLLLKRQIFSGHGTAPYVPQVPDPLIIDIVPDIFATGHIHKYGLGEYKGVTLLNAGCWQETTPFQKKVGHEPDPGKAIAINLKTREKFILTFYNRSQ